MKMNTYIIKHTHLVGDGKQMGVTYYGPFTGKTGINWAMTELTTVCARIEVMPLILPTLPESVMKLKDTLDEAASVSPSKATGYGVPQEHDRYPVLANIIVLTQSIKDHLTHDDDYNTLTVGMDDPTSGDYGWQSGDNSFTGGAYMYKHWGVATIDHDTDAVDAAQDILQQILEAHAQTND